MSAMHRLSIVSAGILSLMGFAGAASAADLAARTYTKAPAMAAPIYNWTGCYVGIEGGGNWGRAGTTAVTAPNPAVDGLPITNAYHPSGGLAGGTVGCNYQVTDWVVGIEGDVSWTDTRGAAPNLAPFTTTSTNDFREKWFDTVRGRVGYAWDRVLLFGTAGGAFAGTTTDVCTNTGVCVSDSQTRSGWVAGGGIEYGVWDNLSLKLEYLHADFGGKNYINPPVVIAGTGTFDTRSIHLTDDIVRVGLNYRFGWGGPVVAKY
jgi:outer membrane immunogenic protein